MAKKVILQEMLIKTRTSLAEEYLKKCLLHFSSTFDVLTSLIEQYSKLVMKYYTGVNCERVVDFVIECVKKSAVPFGD